MSTFRSEHPAQTSWGRSGQGPRGPASEQGLLQAALRLWELGGGGPCTGPTGEGRVYTERPWDARANWALPRAWG